MTATPSTARERVHAMESLAAVIAHELRAGVLGITSAAQLLRYSVPPDPVAEKSLGRILQESERLSAIHDALTEYATALPPRFTTADPDDVWTDVIRGMRGALEAKGVTLTHSAKPSTARLDEEQLGRAFERAVHHTLGRVSSGAEVDVVSSNEDGWWSCAIAAREASQLARPEAERPSFSLVLAQRTLVAHGGEVVDHGAIDAPLLLTIRLPLSLHPE
jgi:light-regulated signal transduction histidine kinase (bacteriophytochrome)